MEKTTTPRARRYTTSTNEDGTVTLRVHEPCVLGDEGDTRIFWAPIEHGYVREKYGARGGLGPQVCDHLQRLGSTLMASRETLLHVIRREARRAIAAEDRARVGPGWR